MTAKILTAGALVLAIGIGAAGAQTKKGAGVAQAGMVTADGTIIDARPTDCVESADGGLLTCASVAGGGISAQNPGDTSGGAPAYDPNSAENASADCVGKAIAATPSLLTMPKAEFDEAARRIKELCGAK
jgi:hypothetical protein